MDNALRQYRLYRVLRTGFPILFGVFRYQWLRFRRCLPGIKPSPQAWEKAHRKTGETLYNLAVGLGGAYVKCGQMMGSRADFFPAALLEPLRGLQDSVPARPFSVFQAHVSKELGRSTDEVFSKVEEQPLAAASLAQVHRATTSAGREVILKIQYPEARKLFPLDLKIFRFVVHLVRILHWGLDLRHLAEEVARFVELELDFVREAESTERVRQAIDGKWEGTVRVPRVIEHSQRVLVLEHMAGVPISRAREHEGVDLQDLAERVADVFCWMIFKLGFFHGDPHPGNILVADDGTISVLDFGLAKELPEGFAEGMAALIVAGMKKDNPAIVEAAGRLGITIDEDGAKNFVPLVQGLMGQYAEHRETFESVRRSLGEIPGHFILIARTLVLLNGLSHTLAPGKRLVAKHVMGKLAPIVAAHHASKEKDA